LDLAPGHPPRWLDLDVEVVFMTVVERMNVDFRPDFAEIVVPVDFSSLGWRVLPLARTVGRAFGASVRPLHVDTSSPWRAEDAQGMTLTAAPFGRRVVVDVIADPDAAHAVATYVASRERALVAMSTHAHSGVGEMAFGSVSEGLIRQAREPVLMVGPEFDVGRFSTVRRVTACVAGAGDAAAIVPPALGWARAFGVPLELITVQPNEPRTDAFVQWLADDLASAYPMVSAMTLVGNRPGREIVRYAKAQPGTLLAMATHARAPLSRVVAGSVVMHVARHSPSGLLLRRRGIPEH
jgi:nucleotide-binding universal stress UspA family protein